MTCFDTHIQQRADIAADIADGIGTAEVADVRFSQDGGAEACDGDEIKCVMIDQHIAQQV